MSSPISIVQIDELIKLQNDKSKQLKSSDYCENGMLPIVDQGAILVCGYTNDLTKKYDKGLPVIIFGDHTLHTKFIDFNFAIGADGTQIIVPRTENCDTKYLYYLVLRAAKLIGSEGYKRHLSILRECAIEFISDFSEQQKIATILTAVDDVIKSTQVQINKLKDLKTGMMQELLTKGIGHTEFKDSPVGRIPKSWSVKTLNELTKSDSPICYGILMPGTGVLGGTPVIKVKDIKENQINESDLLLTSKDIDEKYARSRVQCGDILLTIRGSTGRLAIVPSSLNGANITQDTARVRIENNELSKFVFTYLQAPSAQEQIESNTIGQAVKGINIAEVRKLMIGLPPEGERQLIEGAISSIDSKLHLASKKMQKLVATKKALMQDLLTGKVRVNVS